MISEELIGGLTLVLHLALAAGVTLPGLLTKPHVGAGIAGEQFVAALDAAQRRGVAVRVLIDGFGGGYFYSWAHRQLRKRGVPVARFLHSEWPWRMPFLNMRLHSKLLLIDGRIGFT